MSGFTPGPWDIGADDQNGQAVVRAEHIEIATCWHHCVGSLEDEMRHNARLIAAAPDLLEALKELYSKVVVGTDGERIGALNRAWDVIYQAEGQP